MLQYLHIRNYALIRQLEMFPVDGLNIITGETGAGKSILLGAVGLLLGNRADTKVLFDNSVKCIIEGHFDIDGYSLQGLFTHEDLDYENQTIIRREISPSGKSRAFINDTPVTLDVLSSLGSQLMDIHSQHESQLLGKSNFQMNLLDAYAGILEERKNYEILFKEYQDKKRQLQELTAERSLKAKEADYQQFIFEELEAADLRKEEQEVLENELELLEHSEEIKSRFQAIILLLTDGEYPAIPSLQEARTQLMALRKYSKEYEDLFQRIESAFLEVDDLSTEILHKSDLIEYDPERIAIIQQRLSLIYQLQQKHHVQTIPELLEIKNRLEQDTHHFLELDETIREVEQEIDKINKLVVELAEILSAQRHKSIKGLENQVVLLLQKVGIPEAAVAIELEKIIPGHQGIDQIRLLFSANKGIAPQPLSKVASGGEFSRFMFCIKHILADKIALPTIIFDEIDTGVSGEVALKMGEMMQFMAANHQVIAISHLPQIAARATRHFFVYKDNTSETSISKIRQLDEKERIEEIAKMIGGDNPSQTAKDSAKELIAISS